MSGLNLSAAAQQLLGKVQALFGAGNVSVTSGQSSRVGVAGGSATSQHPSGNAFDFHVTGMTPAQVQTVMAQSGIPFGQSIQEYGAAAGAGLNHLGVGTKGQLLTGNNGTYKTTGFAAGLPSNSGNAFLDGVRSFESDALKQFGFSNSSAKILTDPNATATDAVGAALDSNFWFSRIVFGIFAILLIAVALFMLSGSTVTQAATKIAPLVA